MEEIFDEMEVDIECIVWKIVLDSFECVDCVEVMSNCVAEVKVYIV